MEVSLNEAETRYYRDLFVCCDVEKTGKVPIIKATELFESAGLNDLSEITSLAGIPATALHISRAQFFGCLKLIAAHQAEIPLRKELIVASNVQLPLPRFSWKQSSGNDGGVPQSNGGEHRKNSLTHSSRRNSNVQLQQEAALNSDVPSTDSEVEQNESSCGVVESGGGHGSSGREMHHRRRVGSPEAWSTNSDSPTPTNSVAERPWAKENLWHGLLGDEHRQLLGTEEESSDRHSSDDDEDLETVYQITPEQREYYYKQFKCVQHDPNGLLSGQVAKDFFEKSRIPVEELRHIWQLCDVTRDGALSLSEFTAAMHLVVLRRNNIPLPTTLPACLNPNVLQHSIAPPLVPPPPQEPPEADLLHLNDDDEEENTENTIINAVVAINTTTATTTNAIAAVATNTINNDKNAMNLSNLSTSSQDVPPTQWTKFSESPTSNVSSPGPKPVNFDMQRTAQAVVSDPQILHPVPLRVTPVGGAIANTATVAATTTTTTNAEPQPQDIGDGLQHNSRSYSPKQIIQSAGNNINNNNTTLTAAHYRDMMQQQSDLRAIQRPQPKKLPNKSVGAIPPPPQREPSVCSSSSGGVISGVDTDIANSSINSQQQLAIIPSTAKKDIQPPLPPPRPHRHGRSNSLDLNKFKIGSKSGQQAEITAQASFDLQTSTGFADFTQFSDDGAKCVGNENAEQQHSLPPQQQNQHQHFENQQKQQQQPATVASPFSRISLQSNQRVSAFEVYRKPNTPKNSQSPPMVAPPQQAAAIAGAGAGHQVITHAAPFGAAGAAAIAGAVQLLSAEYEKRVNAITESLRHVSFRPESNVTDILRHLREQNGLLLHLCNDLSDELYTVQTRKEELRLKLATMDLKNTTTVGNSNLGTGAGAGASGIPAPPRTGSSISAPVTANVTGGSGSSGVHSNV